MAAEGKNMERHSPEITTCPDRNERCAKLARKAIKKFQNGRDTVQLDPRLGGLVWNIPAREPQHYDHIAAAVEASGVEVARDDTARLPGTDLVPTYGLKRLSTED